MHERVQEHDGVKQSIEEAYAKSDVATDLGV